MVAIHPTHFHQPSNSKKNYNYNAFVYTNTAYRSHFHSNYELIYVMEGILPLTVNGMVHQLQAGELFLLNPYAVHAFEAIGDCRIWVGVFSDDHVPAFVSRYGKTQWSKFKCDPKTQMLLEESLFIEGNPPRLLRIAYLYLACEQCVSRAEPLVEEIDRNFAERVITYLSEHIEGDISLRALAEYYNYEYHYFSSLFHQCFFMNFKELLNIFRVERACELLSDSDIDITDICSRCGFSSIRNFNRVFVSSVGCTPSEYRQMKF